jgi:hypothetical protein
MGNIFDRGHAPVITVLVKDGFLDSNCCEELGMTALKLDATTTLRMIPTAMRHKL